MLEQHTPFLFSFKPWDKVSFNKWAIARSGYVIPFITCIARVLLGRTLEMSMSFVRKSLPRAHLRWLRLLRVPNNELVAAHAIFF